MTLQPGEHLLLKFKVGSPPWRHCVVLTGADGTHHWVLTPSRAVRRQGLSDVEVSEIVMFNGSKLPARLVGERANMYLDVDSPQGRFTKEEITAAVTQAGAPARRLRGKSSGGVPLPLADGIGEETSGDPKAGKAVSPRPRMKVMTLETGGRAADAASLDGEAAPDLSPRPVGRTGDLKDGEGWYILVGRGPLPAGSPISLRGLKHSLLGDLALFDKAGVTLVAYWSTAEEAAAKLRRLQISTSGRSAGDFEGLSEIFRAAGDTPLKGPVPADAQLAEDLRVLAVHYERDGRRFRRLADCEPDYFEEVFDDWPLRGDRNTGNNMRDLRREDRTWLTHHEDWVSKSGVRQNDRSVHEHKALCTALYWGTVYDQLQLPNLAMAETLNNRRQLIEHAHEGHPEQPRWDGADD